MNRQVLLPQLPELPAQYLARPRLHRLLDKAVGDAPVTMLRAPAASGKTTLLLGWNASGSAPDVAYLALDVLDNDPAWFWSRVAQALLELRPDRGSPAFAAPVSGQERRFLNALLTELSELGEAVLVLDNVDALSNAAVSEPLGDFLLDLPASLRVILAGRSEPHPRTGLLRARGRLAEVPARELAFDANELASYLGRFDALPLGHKELQVLHEHTEGWIGGVTLAALALARHPDPQTFVQAFSGTNRHVADLLRSEVLDAQTDEVRHFLLRTSVLHTFDAALCDVVTGSTASAAILEELDRSGLFVEPIDDRRSAFRYHRLFGEFLRYQLRLVDPEGERRARRAAADWFESREDITAAIRHLVAGDEAVEAARLVLRHGERFAAAGQVARVREWLTRLPGEVLTSDLALLMGVSRLCVMTGLRDEALMWIERAGWRLSGADDPQLTVELGLLRAYTRAHVGQLETAVGEAQQAVRAADELGVTDPTLLARLHHLLGGVYAALDEFDAVRRHRHAAPPTDESELRTAYSAWLSYRVGNLARAVEDADDVLTRQRIPWLHSAALTARGAVRRERHQLADAENDLLAALDLADQWSRPLTTVFAAMELAQLHHAQGRAAEAHDVLAAARPKAEGPYLRHRVDATLASIWLREGDVERSRLLRRELPTGRETALLDIRLALASGEITTAIDQLVEFELEARSTQDRISARLLQARARVTVDEAAALANLRDAIELGRREGFVQVLVMDLHALGPLLRRLAAESDDPYLFGLLAATAEPVLETSARAVGTGADTLSTREQIVLRYLPTSLSNKEIAAQLHVSVNTLKTHLKSINRKLGAKSRLEAVAVARSLKLF